jgi:ArsR family transcriptional regulator
MMPTPDALPDNILNLMAGKFRMLSDPTRLAILRTLMVGGEMSVGRVVGRTGREMANVSKHLNQLAGAGLVARRKEGLQVFYRLDDPVIEKICHLVCESIYQEIEEQTERQRELLQRRKKRH